MNEIEYNFIQNQINANNKVRSILQYEMASLLNIIRQQRQWMDQVDQNDKELNLRLEAIKDKDKKLIKHHNN